MMLERCSTSRRRWASSYRGTKGYFSKVALEPRVWMLFESEVSEAWA